MYQGQNLLLRNFGNDSLISFYITKPTGRSTREGQAETNQQMEWKARDVHNRSLQKLLKHCQAIPWLCLSPLFDHLARKTMNDVVTPIW